MIKKAMAFLVATALALTVSGVGNDSHARGRDLKGWLKSGGINRSYLVHLPITYTGKEATPLVLSLHGRLGAGKQQAKMTGMSRIADREGFIVVYPDGVKRGWADGRGHAAGQQEGLDDVAFFKALIAKLENEYNVDPARIYATGMSNGGFMSLTLACELPDKIAAAAPVAATMGEVTANKCEPASPTSVIIINGTRDPLIRWNGGHMDQGFGGMILSAPQAAAFWAAKNGCATEPSMTELPDRVDDGTSVRVWRHAGCGSNSGVVLYEIVGGGHTWPGAPEYLPANMAGHTSMEIDASELIWEFFAKHPKG